MKKSRPEPPPRSPFCFHPYSNGEMPPLPVTERARLAEDLYRRLVDEKARRLGISRRAFVESACGMAAALLVANQVSGCAGSGAGKPLASAAGAGPAPGAGAGGGQEGGGFRRADGYDVPRDVSAADAARAAADAGYQVPRAAAEDRYRAAAAVASRGEFVFDVQVHNRVPRPPWNAETCGKSSPMVCPTQFIREIFVASDTEVACLSGFPAARANDQPSIEARRQIKEIVDRLSGSPRLFIHANVRPVEGRPELDAMEMDAKSAPVAAWKVYPERRGLDTDEAGRPFIERARQLGVKLVAAHRGIGGDNGLWTGMWSPRDVVAAAKASPDFGFLVYHAGWQQGVDERHPFNTADPSPRGVDRLIKACRDAGFGPNRGNVYAELGSTWYNLMVPGRQEEAAHVLGKLLKYLGSERIMLGTDCVLNGNPQGQIAALRAFSIPPSMQELYGYPALDDATRRNILGLNGARVYGVDVAAVRRRITSDDIAAIKLARREDPAAEPLPYHPSHGPRTRREYEAFLAWSGEGA